jgi:hypothetical protein
VSLPNGAVYGWKYEAFKNSVDNHGTRALSEGVFTLKEAGK